MRRLRISKENLLRLRAKKAGLRAEVVPLTTTWRDHFRPPTDTEITRAWVTGSRLHAELTDGREVAVPVSWLLLCLRGEEAGHAREQRTRIVRADLWDPQRLRVDLEDGRTVWVPWSWFPILERASRHQRVAAKIWGAGSCLVWDELNTEVCLEGQILGVFGSEQLPESGNSP